MTRDLQMTLTFYYHRLLMAEKYDTRSADDIDMEKLLESTDNEKIALDDILANYKNSDTKSADDIDMEKLLESTDTGKIALDDVLANYKNSIFELINIIAHNIDEVTQKRGLGDQIIKQSLVEFDRRIEKQKGNKG